MRRQTHDWFKTKGSLLVLVIVLGGGCTQTDISSITKLFPFPIRPPETVISETPVDTGGSWHRNITATYFDIATYKRPQTAWNDMDALDENPYYLALPFNNHVPGLSGYGTCKNRWIEIVNVQTGQKAYGQWEDVGPWFVNDAAYVFDETGSIRPFAELHEGEEWSIYREQAGNGARKPRPVLNRAGIDLSPPLLAAAGISGKGLVDWRFIESDRVPDGPWKVKVSTSPPHYRQKFYSFHGIRFNPWELTTTREE